MNKKVDILNKHYDHPLDKIGRCILGAHTSASGDPKNAIKGGLFIRASGVQFFTANQKRWNTKTFDPKTCLSFDKFCRESEIITNMSHGSYLVNLGSNKSDLLEKSRALFLDEIKRCQDLRLSFLVFHPGASTGAPKSECLDRIVESISLHKDQINVGPTQILIECTAGQGSNVGDKFEDLAYLINKLKPEIQNIGICLDTCHMFAAGYDIRTSETFNASFELFDKIVGLEHLKAFHVNDSLSALNSNVDRHSKLGEGYIGWDFFQLLMTDPKTRFVPKYLETPGDLDTWKKEIEILREFADGKSLKDLSLQSGPKLKDEKKISSKNGIDSYFDSNKKKVKLESDDKLQLQPEFKRKRIK